MDALQSAFVLDPELCAALLASRSNFFPGEGARPESEAEASLAERRHLEWFLTERASTPSQEARIAELVDRSAEEAGADASAWRTALENSHASLFEVTAVEPGIGMTIFDLAGLFECRVVEEEASAALAVGDLVAGRVFPIGDGSYRVSPAASVWRSAPLLAAIRADLERARANRSPSARGLSRLHAPEIEAILRARTQGDTMGRAGPAGAVHRARELFRENGLSSEDADEFLEWLARETPDPARIFTGGGDVLGEVLDALAFETRVDLDAARAVLIEAWDELHAAPRTPMPIVDADPDPSPSLPDVATAIAEFDRKRRGGAPLDQAIADLERDLDLDTSDSSEEPDEADEAAPDLPGVVAGVVEEFLWDEGRVHGEERAVRYRTLRGLGQSANHVSILESLGRRELTDFACRWAIDSGDLRDPEDAEILLEGLERFCQWTEENHGILLHDEFAPVLDSLRKTLPRLTLANRTLDAGPATGGLEWFEIAERHGSGGATLADLSGRSVEAAMNPSVLEHLLPGDLVRAGRTGNGDLRVHACYPAELRRILEA